MMWLFGVIAVILLIVGIFVPGYLLCAGYTAAAGLNWGLMLSLLTNIMFMRNFWRRTEATLMSGAAAAKVGRCGPCMTLITAAAAAAWVTVAVVLASGVMAWIVGCLVVANMLSALVLLHGVAYLIRRSKQQGGPGTRPGSGRW